MADDDRGKGSAARDDATGRLALRPQNASRPKP